MAVELQQKVGVTEEMVQDLREVEVGEEEEEEVVVEAVV